MTPARLAINTLSRIVRNSEGFGHRVNHLTKTILRELVCGATKYVVHLSPREIFCLRNSGFSVKEDLRFSLGRKTLCEVTIS